jgi:hypothetical protein
MAMIAQRVVREEAFGPELYAAGHKPEGEVTEIS